MHLRARCEEEHVWLEVGYLIHVLHRPRTHTHTQYTGSVSTGLGPVLTCQRSCALPAVECSADNCATRCLCACAHRVVFWAHPLEACSSELFAYLAADIHGFGLVEPECYTDIGEHEEKEEAGRAVARFVPSPSVTRPR